MSDTSSEISDNALDKLVSRLVEVAEEDGSMQVRKHSSSVGPRH